MPGTSCQVGGPFRAWQSSKWLEMGYKLLVYSELCKISELERNFRKVTPALSDEMSYTVWPQDVKDFMVFVRVPFPLPRTSTVSLFSNPPPLWLHFKCHLPLPHSLSLSCCLLWGNWKEIIITCTICSWVVRVSWHALYPPPPEAQCKSFISPWPRSHSSCFCWCCLFCCREKAWPSAEMYADYVRKCWNLFPKIYNLLQCALLAPQPPFLVPFPRLLLLKNFQKCVACLNISLFLSRSRLLSSFSIFYLYFRKQKTLKIKRINVALLCIRKS